MAALFPKRVQLDEASISQLTQLYADTNNDLNKTVITLASTGLTIRNVQQARAAIGQRIQQLGGQVGQWVDTNIPSAYQQGQSDAVAQLKSFKHPVTDLVAAGILAGGTKLTSLHDDAVHGIKTTLASNLSGALTNMARSADSIMADALRKTARAQIAGTAVDSKATQDLKASIMKNLDNNGISAIVDKAGRQWAPDVYAENLARTSLTQAKNTGLSNALASQDYDLVEVSSHGAEDVCGDWEGEILSINGQTEGYDTVDDATAAGLFHNNCQHALAPADPDEYPTGQLPYSADTTIDETD